MRSLCPMTMPGKPEKLKPATSNGHFGPTVVQCRPIWYQTEGRAAPRCGSLASNGLPLGVCAPPTTHELEPMPSPAGPISWGSAWTLAASCSSPDAYCAGSTAAEALSSALPEDAAAPGCASGVTVRGLPPPRSVIVGWVVYE